MGLYDGNNMRGMSNVSYDDTRMNKDRELNDTMSIDTNKSEDQYGTQVHSLNKQSYSDSEDVEEV